MTSYAVAPALPDDRPAITEILYWAFTGSPADVAPHLDRMGLSSIRVIRDGDRAVGCLAIIWMGQWFGGVSIPMAGIAAVGVAPDARGQGAAGHLMREALAEARAKGFPLSALYPATQPVYRSVGYEQAGCRWELRLPTASIDVKDRALDLELILPEEHEAIAAVYAARARLTPGHLDRDATMWERIRKPKGEPPRGIKVTNSGRIEGYVYLNKQVGERNLATLTALDAVALTGKAARRLLTLFADHRSLAPGVILNLPPGDPMLALLREQSATARAPFLWMLRLLDVPAALSRRGYPPGITGELHLRVRDELFPDNAGDWLLEVADGRGQVRRGGRGSFQAHVRGLAALYSGFQSPPGAVALGLLDASEAEMRIAAALFAGPAPWMPDMF